MGRASSYSQCLSLEWAYSFAEALCFLFKSLYTETLYVILRLHLTKGLKMSLADSIKIAVEEAPLNAICSVRKVAETLSKEDRDTLESAIYDRSIKASVLGRALAKEKIEISVSTITRHRNNGCANCAK